MGNVTDGPEQHGVDPQVPTRVEAFTRDAELGPIAAVLRASRHKILQRRLVAARQQPLNAAAKRAAELLERFGLTERADDPVETYSRGMRQRLHVARDLVAGARVLFLDERTTGMDPLAAREFRTLGQDPRSEGCTVLLTTHDMVEAFCGVNVPVRFWPAIVHTVVQVVPLTHGLAAIRSVLSGERAATILAN